jgi:hypothetical protein
LARRFSNKNPDYWAAPLAGLIAGMWLKLDVVEGRRNLIMILVFSKAIDCILNILIRQFYNFKKEDSLQIETNQRLDRIKTNILTFIEVGSSAWCALAYCYYYNEIMHKSLVKLYKDWSVVGLNDHAILGIVNDP